MCTALTFTNRDCYFGRTLDLEYNYNEEIWDGDLRCIDMYYYAKEFNR